MADIPAPVKREPLSKFDFATLFLAQGGKCAKCGCKLERGKVRDEHLHALHLGGTNELSNRALWCLPCTKPKDTTKAGEIVFVWNDELPPPYAPGQYMRLGHDNWTASTEQYDFQPATVSEARAALSALPARDEGLEALRELSKRATGGDWIVPPTADDDVWNDNGSGSPGIPLLRSERGNYRSWGRQLTDDERRANSALAAAAVNYVRNKLAQEPRK